ncbi:tetratricopeptide repeat protein [Sulfurimonas sp. HSL3-7]|uniref:tetratricopeptide repeat protein n=1 Tax=Sulfonitrofixus jiaomeiensis TaxID=3131938 RepID=UPI0031F98E7E
MSLYLFLTSLFISFVFTACTPAPDVPLSAELSQYAEAQERCEGLRTEIAVADALENECHLFLNRLEKANALDYKIAHFNDDNPDPNAKPKPEYILLQTESHRQHLKSSLAYQKLIDTLNRVSATAIANDELSDVELTLTFSETEFTKQHYHYYKRYAPQFDTDPRYLAFEKQYAKELLEEGLLFLSQGEKHRALKNFKEAAVLHSAQAEYLAGIIYEAKHVDKAIEWHTKAQAHGIKEARLHLARLYKRKMEPKESLKWYLAAAEDGDAYAQFLLYQQYITSTSQKTEEIADKWLQHSAENGFPPAEYAYAERLEQNNKPEEAKTWLLRAKDHGITAANGPLGGLYFEDKEYEKAYPLLDAAKSATAKYRLGVMFERGLGVEPDYYSAYQCYKEAARLGYGDTGKEMARVDKLKTQREQAYYEAAKRKKRLYKKELAERCGERAIKRIARTKDTKVYLNGLVSLPLEDVNGFLLHTDDGRQFYVIDTDRQAGLKPFQHADITAISTGNAITVSSDNRGTRDVYQFYFQQHCQP